MRIGAVFPQTEIGGDPGSFASTLRRSRRWASITSSSTIMSLAPASRTDTDWRGPYTSETLFHEPFVLFGYLAALTKRLELVTGVIILPQRQTVLVAKQAAEVDVLSGGECAWASVSAGTRSSTRRSTRTFAHADAGWKNRSRSCVRSGCSRWCRSKANGTPSPRLASIHCQFSDPFRSGSAARRSLALSALDDWAMAGCHRCRRTSAPTSFLGK